MSLNLSKLQAGGSDGEESACNARDLGSVTGSGKSPGEGNGNPFQYFCLGNPMNRGAWQATFHGAVKSQTQLRDWTTSPWLSHPPPLHLTLTWETDLTWFFLGSRSLQPLSGSCLPLFPGRKEWYAGVGTELLPFEMATDASWLSLSWLNQGSVVWDRIQIISN